MSGPSTERVEFDEIQTHGQPVRLSEEVPAKLPGEVALGEDPRVEVKTYAAGDGKPSEEDQKRKLAVAGAVIAAGVAIVLGVRHFRGHEVEDQSTKHKIKRKAEDAKDDVKGLLDTAGEKIQHAVPHVNTGTAGSAKEALGSIPDKVQELQEDAKESVEEYTSEADKRASSPAADLEQRRMTYGEGDHGVPKGLGGQKQPSADAGFLGFKNWWPFGQKQ